MSTPESTPTPHAYQTWRCSPCGSELMEERTDDWDLRCETCGHTWRIEGYHAVYVPDPEETWDEE